MFASFLFLFGKQYLSEVLDIAALPPVVFEVHQSHEDCSGGDLSYKQIFPQSEILANESQLYEALHSYAIVNKYHRF